LKKFLYLVESKSSELYRTQINELKDEITDLKEKLRLDQNEMQNIEEERYNLFDLFYKISLTIIILGIIF